MKTAVSIPDPVFAEAERLAKARNMSRSELYSRALTAYVEQHSDDAVTKALNRFYGQHLQEHDLVMESAQRRSLRSVPWEE